MISNRRCHLWNNSLKGVLAVLLTSFALSSAAQTTLTPAAPESVGMSSARFRLLSTMLHQHVDNGRVAGLVAGVARNGRIVYLESIGWQDVEAGSAMQDASIFQIRSMSKPITSLAVMQLIEAGNIALDDPVSKYIPAFADMTAFTNPADPDNRSTRAHTRAITIEDLLTHMGGISHRDGALYQSRQVRSRGDTLAQFVDKLVAVPLMADPGTRWIYSESTTVLGRIVELVSEQDFDDYLREHVFAPLQMKDTGFYAVALPIGLSPQNPMLALGWGYGFTVVIDEAQSDYAVHNGEFGWNGSLGTFSWADPETNTVAILMMQIVPSGAYSLSGKFKTMVAQTIVEPVADHQ